MGVNDAQEMLEAAQAECIRLEKELAELTSSSGSDRIAAKYWKQRQDARSELCTVKDERDAAKWERDAARAVIEQVQSWAKTQEVDHSTHQHPEGGDLSCPAEPSYLSREGRDVAAILAQSPASALDSVKADAWDEGIEAGYDHSANQSTPSGIPMDPPVNPYREEVSRG